MSRFSTNRFKFLKCFVPEAQTILTQQTLFESKFGILKKSRQGSILFQSGQFFMLVNLVIDGLHIFHELRPVFVEILFLHRRPLEVLDAIIGPHKIFVIDGWILLGRHVQK